MKEVDARGFSCPIPVVRTKNAMDQDPNEQITVLLDSAASKENVTRLARSRRYSVAEETIEDGFQLHLSPSA